MHYHHEYVLHSWAFDIVPSGKYVVPFGLRLKKNLPGSFTFKKEDFEILTHYSIKLVLSSHAEGIKSLSKTKSINIWPLIVRTFFKSLNLNLLIFIIENSKMGWVYSSP